MPVRALGSTVCTVVACFRLTACRLRRPSSRLLSFFGSILDSFRNLFVRGLTVIPITDARQKQLVRPSADCTGFQGKFFKIPEFRNKVLAFENLNLKMFHSNKIFVMFGAIVRLCILYFSLDCNAYIVNDPKAPISYVQRIVQRKFLWALLRKDRRAKISLAVHDGSNIFKFFFNLVEMQCTPVSHFFCTGLSR